MSRKTFKVDPKSILDIRKVADVVRNELGTSELPTGKLMEILLYLGLIHVLEDDDPIFANHAEARFDPEQKCVFLRQFDYNACARDTRPRSKYTLWHELGHFFLGHKISFARGEGIEGDDIKPYESSEWQADQFAAEILMPLEIMIEEKIYTVNGLVERFGVSMMAAKKRIRQLREHGCI